MARGGQNNHNNQFQAISLNSSKGVVAQESHSSMENVSSPFLLHYGDHLGMVLVSHLFTSPNYNTWSHAMLMAPNTKNKLGFVDGSILQPKSGDLNARVWSQCNSMVTSWLLNFVSKEIADSLLYLDTAQAVWTDLHD